MARIDFVSRFAARASYQQLGQRLHFGL